MIGKLFVEEMAGEFSMPRYLGSVNCQYLTLIQQEAVEAACSGNSLAVEVIFLPTTVVEIV